MMSVPEPTGPLATEAPAGWESAPSIRPPVLRRKFDVKMFFPVRARRPGPALVSEVIVADWPMTALISRPVSARPLLTVRIGLTALKRSWVKSALPVLTVGVVERLLFVAVSGFALVSWVMLRARGEPEATAGFPKWKVGALAPPSLTNVRLANVCVMTLKKVGLPMA